MYIIIIIIGRKSSKIVISKNNLICCGSNIIMKHISSGKSKFRPKEMNYWNVLLLCPAEKLLCLHELGNGDDDETYDCNSSNYYKFYYFHHKYDNWCKLLTNNIHIWRQRISLSNCLWEILEIELKRHLVLWSVNLTIYLYV